MTTDEARHDRQVCATFARRWHATGRIVSLRTADGPIAYPLDPSDPRPRALVQFEVSAINPVYSGMRVSIGLDRLSPRFRPEGPDCPICRARNDAESDGQRAAAAIDHWPALAEVAARFAECATHHAREYFRLIEEDHE